jgi:hypothetical protein
MPGPAFILTTSAKIISDKNMHKGDSMLRNRAGERRSHSNETGFPLSDSRGVLVLGDRRVQPDRSLGNIQVEWLGYVRVLK